MTTVQRYDRAAIKASKTDEGFLVDAPALSRSGVFTYFDAAGKPRLEYRPPEEVFHADHLKSMRGKPVTNGHPSAGVDAKNARAHSVGAILSDGRRDGDSLVADIIVHDTSAIDAGARELSLGYTVHLDETPGVTPDGQRYDAVQRGMRVNHAAIVPKGRAGNAKLNLDAAEIATPDPTGQEPGNPAGKPAMKERHDVDNTTMTDVRLDSSGLTYKAAPEVKVEIDRLKSELAEQKTRADAAEAKADAAQAKIGAAQAEIDAAKAKAKDDAEKLRADAIAVAKARLAIEGVAATHKVEVKTDSTDRSIKEGVIRAIRGDSAPADLSTKADAYVDVAYDLAVADAKERSDASGEQRRQANGAGQDAKQRQDGGDRGQPRKDAVEDAFFGMINRYKSGAAPAKA